jgi:hypothetical protein
MGTAGMQLHYFRLRALERCIEKQQLLYAKYNFSLNPTASDEIGQKFSDHNSRKVKLISVIFYVAGGVWRYCMLYAIHKGRSDIEHVSKVPGI